MENLKEDLYGGLPGATFNAKPTNNILRFWLSNSISRKQAEEALGEQYKGSYIVRRSESSKNNYAVSVANASGRCVSYKVTDLGCGQIGIQTGQSFSNMEKMLEFFYDKPFPENKPGNECLQYMFQGQIPGCPPTPQYVEPAPDALEDQGTFDPDGTYQDIDETGQGGNFEGETYEDADESYNQGAAQGGSMYGDDTQAYGDINDGGGGGGGGADDMFNYGDPDDDSGGAPAPAGDFAYGDPGQGVDDYGDPDDDGASFHYGDGDGGEMPYGDPNDDAPPPLPASRN